MGYRHLPGGLRQIPARSDLRQAIGPYSFSPLPPDERLGRSSPTGVARNPILIPIISESLGLTDDAMEIPQGDINTNLITSTTTSILPHTQHHKQVRLYCTLLRLTKYTVLACVAVSGTWRSLLTRPPGAQEEPDTARSPDQSPSDVFTALYSRHTQTHSAMVRRPTEPV